MTRWLGVDVGATRKGFDIALIDERRLETLAGRRDDAVLLEVFPTASWTRWIGPRATQSRADWTRHGLGTLGLAGVPDRTNQDQRDAIAAAVTARQFSRGMTETIGEIVVPR